MKHLIDPLIRFKARLHDMPADRFRVRVARSTLDYRCAFSLVKRSYDDRGYTTHHINGFRMLPQHTLPESTVLVAVDGRQVVGTLTVILDSPAGLPIEEAYPDAIQALRRRGARLVEYSSLAVDPAHRRQGVARLMFLMANHLAFSRFDCTHCTIGVIPQAAPLYRALFDFHALGAPFRHDELGCSGIGLCQDLRKVRQFVRRHYHRRTRAGLTVFDLWASPPACIEVPPAMDPAEWVRWKMPRPVFEDLFIRETNMLESMAPQVLDYLRAWRTAATFDVARPAATG